MEIPNRIGLRFGMLEIIGRGNPPSRYELSRWRCKCDCGIVKDFYWNSLKQGNTKSCGNHMPRKAHDLSNKRFGTLVAIKRTFSESKKISNDAIWLCKCDCGNHVERDASSLKKNKRQSCGCMRNKWSREGALRHGKSNTPTYRTWDSMKRRCKNKNTRSYKRYGGRGISYCQRWEKFENFIEDMGEKPKGKSLDRINNDGNYESANCRWATPTEQSNNTNRSISAKIRCMAAMNKVESFGINFLEACKIEGISPKTLRRYRRLL